MVLVFKILSTLTIYPVILHFGVYHFNYFIFIWFERLGQKSWDEKKCIWIIIKYKNTQLRVEQVRCWHD